MAFCVIQTSYLYIMDIENECHLLLKKSFFKCITLCQNRQYGYYLLQLRAVWTEFENEKQTRLLRGHLAFALFVLNIIMLYIPSFPSDRCSHRWNSSEAAITGLFQLVWNHPTRRLLRWYPVHCRRCGLCSGPVWSQTDSLYQRSYIIQVGQLVLLINKIVRDCSNLPYTHNTYTQEYHGWHISYADTYNFTNIYTYEGV